MTSRDFCFWLQGMFEISSVGTDKPPKFFFAQAQTECVRKHLALVFAHEIDPSMGPPKHQDKLNDIHKPVGYTPGVGPLMRC